MTVLASNASTAATCYRLCKPNQIQRQRRAAGAHIANGGRVALHRSPALEEVINEGDAA
jgi:RES domain-containing protein